MTLTQSTHKKPTKELIEGAKPEDLHVTACTGCADQLCFTGEIEALEIGVNRNDSWLLPMCGRFIVDKNSIIRNTEVHVDHTQRPEPDEIIDLLKSMA